MAFHLAYAGYRGCKNMNVFELGAVLGIFIGAVAGYQWVAPYGAGLGVLAALAGAVIGFFAGILAGVLFLLPFEGVARLRRLSATSVALKAAVSGRRLAALLAVALLAGLLVWGIRWNGTPASVTKATGLFATEDDAAMDGYGSLNHAPPKRLADLPPGASVVVLSDTYGKDYWACKVRVADATGWVLCTSLDYGKKN